MSLLRRHSLQVLSLLIAVGVVLGIWALNPDLRHLKGYGYVGVFVASMVSSATVLIPLPGLTVVLAMGRVLNPFLVGIAGGLGAATGELTGFLAGYGSRAVLEEHPNRAVRALEPWVRRYGFWAVLALAAVPNPAFDAVGILAGALSLPLWKFFLAAAVGNCIKATYVALAGSGLAVWIFG